MNIGDSPTYVLVSYLYYQQGYLMVLMQDMIFKLCIQIQHDPTMAITQYFAV